ncbi:unnamed protein product [Linum trigynum]|uniref:Uncharacterized protein n=1 Tax=Linum trigynum TaxID=586398 RepID=A0AAV2GTT8_9ROSI
MINLLQSRLVQPSCVSTEAEQNQSQSLPKSYANSASIKYFCTLGEAKITTVGRDKSIEVGNVGVEEILELLGCCLIVSFKVRMASSSRLIASPPSCPGRLRNELDQP